ncbi:hypothetical protein SAMN05444166_7287 [Singulisphaera sp. GP187]|uniref:hypothetical protein n=1 Tax=Singulisphaera sp. GP187 TaxID=1882752 RepID=UPI00092607B5|nr:hypothetical protein [Singulisphaera sp. GP187]SIO63239.1 hypothetical protein SAMN05444166_7287 [Singulisphaera sp. GP187]
MLTELQGKAGNLCSHAKAGEIRCPLIVRTTSEDVITGHIFQALSYLNARWWLPDFLNEALGTARFRRQVFRRFKIQLWQNQPCYPKELLPWDEGSTQVDAVLTWENPPTTVFIEAKYGAALSTHVSGDDGQNGYPSDQLIRNIRVGLHQAGYLDSDDQLFAQSPRDFVVLVLSPQTGHPLVDRYRDPRHLQTAIPHFDRLVGLPRNPFVGQLGYREIISLLRRQSRWMTRAERHVVEDLTDYLEFKQVNLPSRSRPDPIASATTVTLPGFQPSVPIELDGARNPDPSRKTLSVN